MIVRRVLKCNAEIGRYIEITRHTISGYYGKYLGERNEFFIARNLQNFRKITVVAVQINAIEFEALRHAFCIHHDLSPAWERVLKIKPEVVKLWNRDHGVIYIWPYTIKRRILGHNNPVVYIDIKSRTHVPNS